MKDDTASSFLLECMSGFKIADSSIDLGVVTMATTINIGKLPKNVSSYFREELKVEVTFHLFFYGWYFMLFVS